MLHTEGIMSLAAARTSLQTKGGPSTQATKSLEVTVVTFFLHSINTNIQNQQIDKTYMTMYIYMFIYVYIYVYMYIARYRVILEVYQFGRAQYLWFFLQGVNNKTFVGHCSVPCAIPVSARRKKSNFRLRALGEP